jgi:hypothetical protein
VALRVLRADAQVRDYAMPRTACTICSYPGLGDPALVVVGNAADDVLVCGEAEVALYGVSVSVSARRRRVGGER